jgi:hypothetical protein
LVEVFAWIVGVEDAEILAVNGLLLVDVLFELVISGFDELDTALVT